MYVTSTGSTSNFLSQYIENMVTCIKGNSTTTKKRSYIIVQKEEKQIYSTYTIVFKTILAFVKSEAVHSIKTFFVFKVMAECAPLIIGGKDKTVLQKVA